jgi:formyl-CoA transferase
VSLLGTLLAALANQATAHLNADVTPGRMGNRHPSITPYETLHAKDRAIAVAVGNDVQFARFAAAIGLPERPEYATNAQRVAHRESLVTEIETLLARGEARDWIFRLTEAGVACGLINTVDEGFALAASLGLEPAVDQSGAKTPSSPITLSEAPVSYRLPPPRLGEHNNEILAWLDGPS